MQVQAEAGEARRRGGIPRGLATDGPALLSYGFRPFFLGAGLFAIVAMALWIGALTEGWEVGGATYGALYWHAHEMLFGYSTAALAGFMLTAIPNWTGRLPVSGRPLLAIVLLWLAGRIVMLSPEAFGLYPAVVIEAAFVPVLAAIAGREIISGRNWKNLKILARTGGSVGHQYRVSPAGPAWRRPADLVPRRRVCPGCPDRARRGQDRAELHAQLAGQGRFGSPACPARPS